MATFNKFYAFTDDIHEGVHTLATDQLEIALTASANTPVNTDTVLGSLTQISYTNLSSLDVTTSSSTQTTGTYSLVNADLVLTATGNVAAFQFIVMFNETASAGPDNLVAWWNFGSALSLVDTETLTLDFGANTFTVGP